MNIFDEIEELRQNLLERISDGNSLTELDEGYLNALKDIEDRIKNKVRIKIE